MLQGTTRSARATALAIAFLAAACGLVAMFISPAASSAADPAVFQVGAASVDVTPTTPQYAGGYGDPDQLISDSHDPLEVRAFVVAKGTKAVAFVIADSTGWFPEYQGAMAGLGTVAAREGAAEKLNARGFTDATRASVIVSSTHTHASPTLIGIWGQTDPAYLEQVRDAAIQAVDEASMSLKPSELWTASGSIRSFVWQNGQGTNHPDGFGVDDRLPVLWARDPQTGATNALYANVPNHPDQFNANDQNAFSADWPGYVRSELDTVLGGTSVIAAGTLGRQEPPGSITDYSEVEKQGDFVTNAITRTLAQAQPITSDRLGSDEQLIETPADNTGLLTLISLWGSPPGGDPCHAALGGNCTIPRANASPFMESGPKIGTYVSSLRIGDILYQTNPGEAFAEVNDAIRSQVTDAADTRLVGMAGDMLGYYYVRGDYTADQFGSSNFPKYNVGPDLGIDNVAAAHEGAGDLGFATTASPAPVHAEFDSSIIDRPGIQFYPTKLESADPEVKLYVSAVAPQKTAAHPNNNSNVISPDVTWDFDDETGPFTSPRSGWTSHTFPGPGTYEVTATAKDETNDTTRTWTQTIVIDPPLSAKATIVERTADSVTLTAVADGGSSKAIAAAWVCPGTETAKTGVRVTCPSVQADTVQVSMLDSGGNTAHGVVDIPAPTCQQVPDREDCKTPDPTCEENPNQEKCPRPEPDKARLRVVRVKSQPARVKRGRKATVAITVRNTGKAAAGAVKACVTVPKRARRGLKAVPTCRKAGSIAAGKTKVVRIKIRTTKRAPGKARLAVKVTAPGVDPARGAVVLKTRR